MLQNHKKLLALSFVIILLIVVAIVVIGLLTRNPSQSDNVARNQSPNQQQSQNQQNTPKTASDEEEPQDSDLAQPLMWRLGANGYEAQGKVPECEESLMTDLPVTLENVTSILYPGQTRGGNYKPHGGFRFDNNSTNEEDVVAPFDGYLVQGAQYLAEGEIQYTFDIIHPCGIMYRLGHLRELTPNFQAIADKFPAATEDSRTTFVNPSVKVMKGELFATKIGIIGNNNTFVDYGVFDLRQKNEASKDPNYATKSQNNSFATIALCWFDYLSAEDHATVRSLPAGDPTSGKNSDYCD